MYNCRGSTGFTLIELMVVLVIFGICAGLVATIVRPDDRTRVALEAERLARLLELAALESRLTASPITWTSDGTGYRFLRHVTADRGMTSSDPETLRPRALPDGMTIVALRVESAAAPVLRLDFAPHAPAAAFAMVVALGAERATITGSPLGVVRVRKSGERVNE